MDDLLSTCSPGQVITRRDQLKMKEKQAEEKKLKAAEKKLDDVGKSDDGEKTQKPDAKRAPKAKAKGKAKPRARKDNEKEEDETIRTPKKKLFQSDDEERPQSDSPTLYLDPVTGEAKTLDQILESYVPKKHQRSQSQPSKKKKAQSEQEMADASREVKDLKPEARVMPDPATKAKPSKETKKPKAKPEPKPKTSQRKNKRRKAAEEDECEDKEDVNMHDEEAREEKQSCEDEEASQDEGMVDEGKLEEEEEESAAKKPRAKAKGKAKAKARGKAKAKAASKRIQESPSVKKEKKRRKQRNDSMMEMQPADMEDQPMQTSFVSHLKRTEDLSEEEVKDYLKCKVGDNFAMLAFSNYWKDKAVGVVAKADRAHITYFGFGKSTTWNHGITLAFVSAHFFVAGLTGWILFVLILLVSHPHQLNGMDTLQEAFSHTMHLKNVCLTGVT